MYPVLTFIFIFGYSGSVFIFSCMIINYFIISNLINYIRNEYNRIKASDYESVVRLEEIKMLGITEIHL